MPGNAQHVPGFSLSYNLTLPRKEEERSFYTKQG